MEDNPLSDSTDSTTIQSNEPKKKVINKTAIFIIVGIIVLLIIGGLYFKMKMTGNAINPTNQGSTTNPQVLIKTSMGDITLELYPDKAPITVKNFLGYVNDGTYDGTVFHRVIKNFMIQGGGFTTDGTQKPVKSPIKLESNNGLTNDVGTIAMARTGVPDSATDQFFINTNTNTFLNYGVRDQGYAVFGKVVSGMDVVNKINNVDTSSKNGMDDWPVQDIKIISVKVI